MIRTLAVAGLAAAFALPAAAQTPDFGGLNALRDNARQLYEGQGYAYAAGPFYMSLADDAVQSFKLPVEKGVEYSLVGMCDNDCTDFDMVLRNGNGEDIGSDLKADDFPIVALQPNMDGVLTIQGVMAACSVAPCYAAIDVYWKR